MQKSKRIFYCCRISDLVMEKSNPLGLHLKIFFLLELQLLRSLTDILPDVNKLGLKVQNTVDLSLYTKHKYINLSYCLNFSVYVYQLPVIEFKKSLNAFSFSSKFQHHCPGILVMREPSNFFFPIGLLFNSQRSKSNQTLAALLRKLVRDLIAQCLGIFC